MKYDKGQGYKCEGKSDLLLDKVNDTLKYLKGIENSFQELNSINGPEQE